MGEKSTKQADEVFCSSCGAIIKIKAVICPKCGVSQKKKSDKSKTTAAVLALFLGGLGVHKFYLGQTLAGFMYLLFCWTFIPALIAFIEFIMLITMSEDKFNNKYSE